MNCSILPLLICLLAAPAGARDLQDVENRGSLRVLVVLDPLRPEFFAEGDGAPGFDREILELFVKVRRLKLETIPLSSWDGLLPALLEGKGDVIAGRYTATETRKKSINFTSEVFPRRLVVITRKPRRMVTTLAGLRAEKVGTQRGTVMAEAIVAAGVPPSAVDDRIPVGGFADALRSGRITAVVWGFETALAMQKEDPDIQVGMFLGKPDSLAYGVRKQDQRLLAALNEHILNLRKSGAWSRLVVKYFGEAALAIVQKGRAE